MEGVWRGGEGGCEGEGVEGVRRGGEGWMGVMEWRGGVEVGTVGDGMEGDECDGEGREGERKMDKNCIHNIIVHFAN